MAKKKEPSISDAVDLFRDIIKRARIESFVYNNRTLMSYNTKNYKSYLTLDQTIWNAIMDEKDIREKMEELDILKANAQDKMGFEYCSKPDEGFIEIDGQEFYDGKNLHIKIDGYEYDAMINKTIFPLRFKKAEFNNISYRVYADRYPVLVVKKKWEPIVPDTEIKILRMFQIL